MPLADVHCHLNHDRFKQDLPGVLARAEAAGVKAVICAGVNPPANREVLALAKKYPLVKAALGLYPVDVLGMRLEKLDEIGLPKQDGPLDEDAELAFIAKNRDSVVALGEVGLDFKHFKEPEHIKRQKEVFAKVIATAEKLKKPLVIHSRNAEADVIEMLQSSGVKRAVLHSFGGRKHLVRKAADLGYSFSIPAVVARLLHFQQIIEAVNINQLLTETDAPWLSPVVGRFSEPADVRISAEMIAKIKGITFEETANATFLNYQRLFC